MLPMVDGEAPGLVHGRLGALKELCGPRASAIRPVHEGDSNKQDT